MVAEASWYQAGQVEATWVTSYDCS
jgi:hypothetical protein